MSIHPECKARSDIGLSGCCEWPCCAAAAEKDKLVLEQKLARLEAAKLEVPPPSHCSPHHPTHFEPSFLELNDIL